MEGCKISSHKDGGDFWQPFLVLKNSPPYWSFRGVTQKVRTIEPQIPGSIVLMDIQKSHCVTGSSPEPWVILCWNPLGSVPEKASCTIDEVLYRSKSEFSRFMNYHLRFTQSAPLGKHRWVCRYLGDSTFFKAGSRARYSSRYACKWRSLA